MNLNLSMDYFEYYPILIPNLEFEEAQHLMLEDVLHFVQDSNQHLVVLEEAAEVVLQEEEELLVLQVEAGLLLLLEEEELFL